MDLPEFLLARIAEDEAGEMHRYGCDVFAEDGRGSCDCGYPARVLAECGAKRRIVAEHAAWVTHGGESGVATVKALTYALRHLALPYADHPDYRDEWRP